MNIKKIIFKTLQTTSFYLLPLGLLAASLLFKPNAEFYAELGGYAWYLVMLILFLTPFAQITNLKLLKTLKAWSRELGVASFWLFLFHAAGLIYHYQLTELSYFTNPKDMLFWGATAGIGMLILGLTSNNFSVRLLKKNWKRIQRISILVLFLAAVHINLAEYGTPTGAFILFGIYLILRGLGYYLTLKRKKA